MRRVRKPIMLIVDQFFFISVAIPYNWERWENMFKEPLFVAIVNMLPSLTLDFLYLSNGRADYFSE